MPLHYAVTIYNTMTLLVVPIRISSMSQKICLKVIHNWWDNIIINKKETVNKDFKILKKMKMN